KSSLYFGKYYLFKNNN
uniref:Uncharacterized protein n=1 Tax=Strongyloides papillosus TaxID=174720 RepID=A0A0N5BGX2_STREA